MGKLTNQLQSGGYTLFEFLIIILVLGILFSISLPYYLAILYGCSLKQSSCINKDPVIKKCDRDVRTKQENRSEKLIIQLRYSPKCRMTWPRTIAPDGSEVFVLDAEGNQFGKAKVSKQYHLKTFYGDMGPGHAIGACVRLPDSQTICTEGATLYGLINP